MSNLTHLAVDNLRWFGRDSDGEGGVARPINTDRLIEITWERRASHRSESGGRCRGLREEGRRPAGEGDRGGLISKEERGRYRCNGGHKISLLGALQYFFF